MPTSIHIPKPLLDAVDRKASALRVSRNRLIVTALEREVKNEGGWSPGFFERLTPLPYDAEAILDETLGEARQKRKSKGAPKL